MVIVNSPGSWQHVYAPLRHSEWNGCTLTDLVFPFFLFFVGVSIALAFDKQLADGLPVSNMYRRIILRALKIYALGLFLWWWPEFDFTKTRWLGVLPRISIVFLVCAFLYLKTTWKQQLQIGGLILIVYWLVLVYLPVPGIGTPDLSVPDKNWANWLDNNFLPGYLFRKTWDPEGILSTLPSIVTAIIGMYVGHIILKTNDPYQRLTYLFFLGFGLMVGGAVWNWFFPINKHIWTSSYVLYTAGLASMGLAGCILMIDIWGWSKWTWLGRVYGANAITSYMLSGLLMSVFYRDTFWDFSISKSYMGGLVDFGLDLKMASFVTAVTYMLIIFLPALWLYRKKIIIKV